MKANVLTHKSKKDAHNYAGEKEVVGGFVLVTHTAEEGFKEPVTVAVYKGRSRSASTVYASVWINASHRGTYANGSGRASGYGYHKTSAAIGAAMAAAGVELSDDIGGAGDAAVERAIEAIGAHLGYSPEQMTIVRH